MNGWTVEFEINRERMEWWNNQIAMRAPTVIPLVSPREREAIALVEMLAEVTQSKGVLERCRSFLGERS